MYQGKRKMQKPQQNQLLLHCLAKQMLSNNSDFKVTLNIDKDL